MARSAVNVQRLDQTLVLAGGFADTETLGSARTIVLSDAQHLQLDPGGAGRDVTLPPFRDGLSYMIVNRADAAEDLTVKDAAAATIVTISQNERAIVASDGSSWFHLGIETIALS